MNEHELTSIVIDLIVELLTTVLSILDIVYNTECVLE